VTPRSPRPVTVAEKGPPAALPSCLLRAQRVGGGLRRTTRTSRHPLRRAPCIWTLLIDLSVIDRCGGGAVTGGRMAKREGTWASAPERPRQGRSVLFEPAGRVARFERRGGQAQVERAAGGRTALPRPPTGKRGYSATTTWGIPRLSRRTRGSGRRSAPRRCRCRSPDRSRSAAPAPASASQPAPSAPATHPARPRQPPCR